MNTTLRYLFDPLCGWCYGAAPALSSLLEVPGATIELLPTGLFAGEGARPMDDDFAAYAWNNDQRIARLTGQSFTERYREEVLGDRRQFFDSGPATVALTAVSLTAPARELDVLKAIQCARFVDGKNITDLKLLASLLASLGLEEAAAVVEHPDTELLEANRIRIQRAGTLMWELGARGVPVFVADTGKEHRMLQSSAIYSDPRALVDQLRAA
ncbi:DSBA oxidoreductase [Marinobacter lipolyticus SM19]|uniref:DSBA oxidoreductase n=1 Tax=Marinobacter lipolyticus SM19 TaxID=1318628 RepID=R8AW50_9GAMM|nr:DsbA family protein [Marinobacter lipolyticus]EON90553.1 DSBA oxidoreductase [Marinobacter lipolyticus SM19]